jgi:hypothetical protein
MSGFKVNVTSRIIMMGFTNWCPNPKEEESFIVKYLK